MLESLKKLKKKLVSLVSLKNNYIFYAVCGKVYNLAL